MNRRERLMATMQGQTVDRPPVCFYELNGLDEKLLDRDPFNIFSHPSWRRLIELTSEKTDRIVMRGIAFDNVLPDPIDEIAEKTTTVVNGSQVTIKKLIIGNRTLTTRTRRDPGLNTTWTEEYLLKSINDLKLFLEFPIIEKKAEPDLSGVQKAETELGDTGIVMIDMPDPLCLAASMFSLGDYSVIAMTEPRLFMKLLDRFAVSLQPQTEQIAQLLPGRLWRIYGPEYAAPPLLPPFFFRDYVCRYDGPMIESIQKHGGFARIHSHGNLKLILDDIVSMGTSGLDPIEPPPQGDVDLSYVRKNYGKQLVLFGNLEITDIENLPAHAFAEKVKRALEEGTSGDGRGFVLMPSACPIGRILSPRTLNNYEKMVELVEKF
jgi:uroporphyrinogen-III decarboxylase